MEKDYALESYYEVINKNIKVIIIIDQINSVAK